MWSIFKFLSKINIFFLCEKYNYWFFLFGMLIESDMFLITSGYFSGIKKMNIIILIISGFILTVLLNEILFLIGRKYNNSIHEYFKSKSKEHFIVHKIHIFYNYFNKYGETLALFFRFIFVIRLIAPFILGTTSISRKKFFISNLIGGFLWSFFMIFNGYLLSFYCSYETIVKIFYFMPFIGPTIIIILWLKSLIIKKINKIS